MAFNQEHRAMDIEPLAICRSANIYKAKEDIKLRPGGQAEEISVVENMGPKANSAWLKRRRSQNRRQGQKEELYVRKKYVCGGQQDSPSPQSLINLQREYNIIKFMDHPNIVRYKDFEYYYASPSEGYVAFLYTDYCEHGDLYKTIQASQRNLTPPRPLSTAQFWEILLQLSSAILYCQTGLIFYSQEQFCICLSWSEPIFHRDIKPANVVIYKWSKDGVIRVKLCDFGLAKQQSSNPSGSLVGTTTYVPPEITEQSREWTEKTDIYSLGRTMEDVLNSLDIDSSEKKGMWNAIKDCVHHDPQMRPRALALLDRARAQVYKDTARITTLEKATSTMDGFNQRLYDRLERAGARPLPAVRDDLFSISSELTTEHSALESSRSAPSTAASSPQQHEVLQEISGTMALHEWNLSNLPESEESYSLNEFSNEPIESKRSTTASILLAASAEALLVSRSSTHSNVETQTTWEKTQAASEVQAIIDGTGAQFDSIKVATMMDVEEDYISKHESLIEMMKRARAQAIEGNFVEAESQYLASVKAADNLLTPTHPTTLRCKAYLAEVKFENGKFHQALKLHRKVLKLRREELGDKHHSTLSSIAYLARIYHKRKHHAEFIKLYEEALDGFSSQYKNDDRMVTALEKAQKSKKYVTPSFEFLDLAMEIYT